MKIIKKLYTMIEEELKDAEKYIMCALKYKEDDLELSKVFYQLSMEEMDHMRRLHEAVVAKIEAYRREKGEPPAAMLSVYEYLHGRQTEESTEIKIMQAEYRS